MLNKEVKIVIAGFGGQGVVLTGAIIARAAIVENLNVVGMVSYGAEMRGGTANATVIVSNREIASPVVERPDIAVVLNQLSLDKFEDTIVEKGLLILNSSMVEHLPRRQDLDVVTVNATEIAYQLGNSKVTNIVTLGALIKKTGLLKFESISQAIEKQFSGRKADMIEINKKAFLAGAEALEASLSGAEKK